MPKDEHQPAVPFHLPCDDPDLSFSNNDPRFSPLPTLLSPLALFWCVIFLMRLDLSVSPVDCIASPERALPLMVGRTMELEEALADAPAWDDGCMR